MPEPQLISWARFTTRGLPPRQQFEAWRGWFGSVYDISPEGPHDEGYAAEARTCNLGGFGLVRVSWPETTTRRSRALIRKDSVDHWMIRLYDGPTALKLADVTRDVPANSPVVMSLAQESERKGGGILTLVLPRDNFR